MQQINNIYWSVVSCWSQPSRLSAPPCPRRQRKQEHLSCRGRPPDVGASRY